MNQGTQTDRVKIYVNGELHSKSNDAQATRDSFINWEGAHFIGARSTDGTGSAFWDGGMSQVYFIDGQALGPENFGFTDPLTNTWRPKKFEHLSTAIATQYSGASALTWDDNPIGSVYTLSNGNRTATASGGSGYTGADVWSNAIPANSTTAWTLEITNSDSVGGWYFSDSQTPSGTHPDERGGNSMGLRNQDADAAFRGTFATANGYSNSGNQLSLLSCHTWGSKRVDFVVYRPASGNGKVWVKNNGSSTWVGGGNPSDTSSTPSFNIPDGDTYFGYTFYDRSNGDQIATFEGDGSIHQKLGPNSFYLPLDGNTPIGKDQSGKGNDWTPINFNCTVPLDQATGAIPIMNTDGGGKTIFPSQSSSVRTEKKEFVVTASGGKYYIDGVETPTLNLIRGGQYTFNYDQAQSHPFRLSTTPDGTHNSGSAYTHNVRTSEYNYSPWTLQINVPHDAPDVLYYYCSAHSGMGSAINITNDILKADPNADNLVLAVPYGRADYSHRTKSLKRDGSSYYYKGVYSDGAPTPRRGANFYSSYIHFDGSDDGYRITDNVDYDMGSGDFTVEMWIHPTTTNHQKLCLSHTSGGDYGWCNWYFNNGELRFYSSSNGSSWISGLNPLVIGTPKLNEWSHIAVTRSGNTFRVFHNGVLTGTATSSATLMNAGNELRIGSRNGSDLYTGGFQDLRIYKGVAKYTTDFTPASSNPNVIKDTPSGVANLSKIEQEIIKEGAVVFNGTSDYLEIPASTDLYFGDDDFCVEMYIYFEDVDSTMGILDWSSNGSTAEGGRIWYEHDYLLGYLSWWESNGSTRQGVAWQRIQPQRWYHFSWHREADTMRVGMNGFQVGGGGANGSTTGSQTGNLLIGKDSQGRYFKGMISNLRITKGQPVYDDTIGGFPNGPVPLTISNRVTSDVGITTTSNVKLLCCKSQTSATATVVEPSSYINTRIPSGFSWWDAGATAGWSDAGSNTSGSNSDYVSVALPTSGKIYWETVVTDPSTYSVIGVTDDGGNAAGNDGYQDNISGYYFNGNPPIYLAKRASANSTASSVTHGSSTGTNWSSGDILMWAVDCGSSRMWIGRNGTWYASGNPAGGTNYAFHNMNVHTGGTYFKLAYHSSSSTSAKYEIKTQANSTAIRAVGANASTFNPFISDDINTVSGQETVHATFNPIQKNSGATLSDGNLKIQTTTNVWKNTHSSIGMKTGKFYCEFGPNLWSDANNHCQPGVASMRLGNTFEMGATNYTAFYHYTGTKFFNGPGGAGTAFGSAWNNNTTNIIGIAFDADTRKVWFSLNGAWQGGGNPSAGTNEAGTINLYEDGTYAFALGTHGNAGLPNGGAEANFGQKPFKFPPPDGFQPLNLSTAKSEKVIAHPDQYVAATTYIGFQATSAAIANTALDTSTAYRYHRILFEGDNNGGSVSEIEFYDASGNKIDASDTNNANGSVDTNGTSALAGWTAFNGTRGGADYAAGVRKDGGGGAGSTGFYISKDWGAGQSKTIYGVKVWGVNNYGLAGNSSGKYMKLQGSNNNSSWTDLQTWNEARYGTSWTSSSSTEVGHVSDTATSNSQKITGLNHKPDLVWIKSRSFANNHHLFDSVRGPNKILRSSTADTESTVNVMTSFNNDGFTVAETGGNNATNDNASTFVAWTWKAGGNKNTFNIDDVGYANASDVNMSVGALNSSAYDQSQRWRDNITSSNGWNTSYPVNNIFNGTFDGGGGAANNGGGGTITFTPPAAITVTKLELSIYSDVTLTLPDGTTQELTGVGSANRDVTVDIGSGFSFTGSNSITISRTSGFIYLERIKINGKELIDDDISLNLPSIAPTGCSVGTKQGFSIVKFNSGTASGNQTIPHKLGNVPSFIIMKSTSNSYNWDIYHKGISNSENGRLILNTTAAFSTTYAPFGGVDPTSSVFTFNQGFYGNNVDSVAYLWCDVPGLQKFGSYENPSSSDGAFVELGFKPAILMYKCAVNISSSSGTGDWIIIDTTRSPVNNPSDNNTLALNVNNAEDSYYSASQAAVDILSNGFKIRHPNSSPGGDPGRLYIYAAWAEAPSMNLYGAQANAR